MQYCVYVFIMGLSGVSEAFIRAVADSSDLNYFKVCTPLGLMGQILGCRLVGGSKGAGG